MGMDPDAKFTPYDGSPPLRRVKSIPLEEAKRWRTVGQPVPRQKDGRTVDAPERLRALEEAERLHAEREAAAKAERQRQREERNAKAKAEREGKAQNGAAQTPPKSGLPVIEEFVDDFDTPLDQARRALIRQGRVYPVTAFSSSPMARWSPRRAMGTNRISPFTSSTPSALNACSSTRRTSSSAPRRASWARPGRVLS
jgi:hypothetical protein